MKTKVCRKAHFNAAHRLHNEFLSEEENQRLFGKCNNPNFHGHNYELIVCVEGEIDPKTGFVMDMKTLETLIKIHIEEAFDHKNLNLEVVDFQELNPTAEHIAQVIYNRLRPHIQESLKMEITLYETPRNFVVFSE